MRPELLTFDQLTAPGETHHVLRVSSLLNDLVGWHRHDFAELFWVCEGRCVHTLAEREEVLGPGDARFLRPEAAHRLHACDAAGFAFFNVAFDARVLEELLVRHPDLRERFFPAAPDCGRAHLGGPACDELEARVLELHAEPKQRFQLEWFLFEAFRLALGPVAGRLPESTPEWLARGLLAASEPERLARGVEAVYEACGRSREHVCRSFRKHLGLTPTAWLTERRLEHARRLLMLSGRTVLEIAFECGFESPSRFYVVFRKRFGVPPAAYRKSMRVA
jgi:AraC family cel operon transcriptional repressor